MNRDANAERRNEQDPDEAREPAQPNRADSHLAAVDGRPGRLAEEQVRENRIGRGHEQDRGELELVEAG